MIFMVMKGRSVEKSAGAAFSCIAIFRNPVYNKKRSFFVFLRRKMPFGRKCSDDKNPGPGGEPE